jgi:CheY-like chemotaxis protein
MGNRQQLLIVDDERLIADTLTKIFSREGFDTRSVYSAEEALQMLDGSEWKPKLVITDVRLPGMNGLELAIRLKAPYPTCHLMIFSGVASTAALLEEAAEQVASFSVLAKPVHPRELLAWASQALVVQVGNS